MREHLCIGIKNRREKEEIKKNMKKEKNGIVKEDMKVSCLSSLPLKVDLREKFKMFGMKLDQK